MNEFYEAYLETALWASGYEGLEIAPETKAEFQKDCELFATTHSQDIGDRLSQAGQDYWLTRNRHGAGFWDGNWPADVGRRLTEAARLDGSIDLYPSADGYLYA